MADDRIGLALSGGGFRATFFGLGVLHYLVDSGHNDQLAAISSVSGGSYASAFIASSLAELDRSIADATPQEFTGVVEPLIASVTTKGIWKSNRFGQFAAKAAIVPAAWYLLKKTLVRNSVVGRAVVHLGAAGAVSVVAQQRGQAISSAIWDVLFGKPAPPLADGAQRGVDHVFCATNLHDGKFIYLSSRFVYSRTIGWGSPRRETFSGEEVSLTLRDAVDASSALPIIFPTYLLPGSAFENETRPSTPREIHAVDGGIYDNLGEQWFRTVSSRLSEDEKTHHGIVEPNVLIVANARAAMKHRKWLPGSTIPNARKRIRFLSSFASIWRVVQVLLHNTTARDGARLARQFKDAFDYHQETSEPPPATFSKVYQQPEERATALPKGIRGSFVGIGDTPLKVPDAILRGTLNGERIATDAAEQAVVRATSVRKTLLELNINWKNLADLNLRVPTQPKRMKPDDVIRLMYHGYVSTWANMHTLWSFGGADRIKTLEEYGKEWGHHGVTAAHVAD